MDGGAGVGGEPAGGSVQAPLRHRPHAPVSQQDLAGLGALPPKDSISGWVGDARLGTPAEIWLLLSDWFGCASANHNPLGLVYLVGSESGEAVVSVLVGGIGARSRIPGWWSHKDQSSCAVKSS